MFNETVPVRGDKVKTYFANSGAEADENAIKIAKAQKGLLLENSGNAGQVVRFLAPLCMTDAQMEAGLSIFEECIVENL